MKKTKITIEVPEQDIFILKLISEHTGIKVIDPLDDRFYMEEIVRRNVGGNDEYVTILTRDWLQEMVQHHPLTEEERTAFLTKKHPHFDSDSAQFFESEEQLQQYLKGEYHG